MLFVVASRYTINSSLNESKKAMAPNEIPAVLFILLHSGLTKYTLAEKFLTFSGPFLQFL